MPIDVEHRQPGKYASAICWTCILVIICTCVVAVVLFHNYQFRQKAKEPRDALDIMIKRMEEKNFKREDIDKIKNILYKLRDDASYDELKQGYDDMSYINIDIEDHTKCTYIFEPLLKVNPKARFYSYVCAYFA